MSLVVFEGDDRSYEKIQYIPKSKHWLLKCTHQVPTEDGETYRCYYEKRDDLLKKEIECGNLHTCAPDKKEHNDIRKFFNTSQKLLESNEEFNADGVYRRLVIILARHNISLSAGKSIEFYNLIL